MLKKDAIQRLGGTPASAAAAIGVTDSAIAQWPEVLPPRLADRVVAAVARQLLPPEVLGEPARTPAGTTP